MTAQELKQLRQSIGLSTMQAAMQVRVAQRSWNRYESGKRKIPDGVVELFCVKNGIDVGKYLK